MHLVVYAALTRLRRASLCDIGGPQYAGRAALTRYPSATSNASIRAHSIAFDRISQQGFKGFAMLAVHC